MKNTTITDEQAESARMAYALFAGIPAQHINLNTIRDERGCGTVGCVAGWISGHPYFEALGLVYDPLDRVICGVEGDYITCNLNDISQDLFGNERLFNGSNRFDSGPLSQKREGLRRIRLHLLRVGRITPQRSDELEAEEREMKS